VLVDTSVWVDHLRRGNRELERRLEDGTVECHPFVIGELACGQLRRRREILALLRDLPQLPVVDHEEALAFVGAHRLHARGVGWVDVHLLAAAMLTGVRLWTLDRALEAAARALRISASPASPNSPA
jgi:predicted nucleic acid-binding protein